MSSNRVSLRLRDIVDNADRIADYVGGRDVETFCLDRMHADTGERCLQRLTEAVIQLCDTEADSAGLALPWHEMRGLGNRLRHDYRRIDRRVIFETTTEDVPALRDAALRALGV